MWRFTNPQKFQLHTNYFCFSKQVRRVILGDKKGILNFIWWSAEAEERGRGGGQMPPKPLVHAANVLLLWPYRLIKNVKCSNSNALFAICLRILTSVAVSDAPNGAYSNIWANEKNCYSTFFFNLWFAHTQATQMYISMSTYAWIIEILLKIKTNANYHAHFTQNRMRS